ncbi:rhamnulokinase [Cryobacterium sp. SO2]|uniref:rhamnulokinase n=1 Tax=Cryobacterium sp. SO2 TaxID=1897060 RepID=UPI00223CE3FA|nr:rhamnulokinase family protein [Cryobacterium sp. SO2]WEO77632.1 rhamnulokinase [Cryobacterium sp. SO2]
MTTVGGGGSGTVAAVDLGASSGRVMLGEVGPNRLDLHSVARFPNNPVRTIDGLHWNILELYRNALSGLQAAVREAPGLASIGIDSWAVDYALLRGDRVLGTPFHYRDGRNPAGAAATHALVPPAELYRQNGLQVLPFNTLYQLAADRAAGDLQAADGLLLIPDLLGFWLTGRRVAERSNASTTGLLHAVGGTSAGWNDALIARLQLPRALFPDLVSAGEPIGALLPGVAAEIGRDSLELVAVGSHDTASAVVAVPMLTDDCAYISSGTWSLVGVELPSPVLTEASRAANFTNEGGVDGRVRYLRNVMGLWLLSESIRSWERGGEQIDLAALLAQAAALPGPGILFDVDDARFLPPGDMPERISDYCLERGIRPPGSRAELVRVIVESLAAAYARALRTITELSGQVVRTVHIVGGGSQNDLLCQLTANHTGLSVQAGPMEATAIGNILVQARTQGYATGSLESLRALVQQAFPPRSFRPEPSGRVPHDNISP